MGTTNRKCNYIVFVCLWSLLFFKLLYTTVAQTIDIPADNTIQNTPLSFSVERTPIHVGDAFMVHLNIENITDLAGWQCDILFDPAALEAGEVVVSDFLDEENADTFIFTSAININNVTGSISNINATRTANGGKSGTGKLLSINFTAKTVGNSRVSVSNFHAGTPMGTIQLNTPEVLITVVEEIGNDPTLSFSTDVNSISVGDTFTLHLNANQFVDLSDWECDLLFDPNVLQVSEVLEGDFLKQDNVSTRFRNSRIDNTAGEIIGLSVTRLAENGVTGTGRLLSIVFTAKGIGEARFTLNNLYAYSSNSEEITLDITEFIVTVSDLNSVLLSFSIDEIPVRVNDTIKLNLNVVGAIDFAGWFCDIVFDPAALEAIEVNEGEFLKDGSSETFFLEGTINNTAGNIRNVGSIRLSRNGIGRTGRLLSVTFTAKKVGETEVSLANYHAGSSDLQIISLNSSGFVITVEERVFPPSDVNQDGQVDILDIMRVAQFLGTDASVTPDADVDSDGTIGILDLIVIAQHIGDTTGSAPTLSANMNLAKFDKKELIPAMIRAWISQAILHDDGSITFQEGKANLQKLLTSLTPERTMLLHNYPNPFNPETWIPYQLAETADVSVTIYTANGMIIRTIMLGSQEAGKYKNRSRAAYWDGTNTIGEPVASGLYFYTLTAGDFTATRKMLIKK